MKIHYISPYRTDKNIGKAINEAVTALTCAEDDWIIHTDHDVLFLLPDTKRHIEEILTETTFDILGCLTNRIGVHEQLVGGFFNDHPNITEHIELAKQCWEANHGFVQATRGPLGAFMLCFRVSVWRELCGFKEGVINFDSLFCELARHRSYTTGIMQGIYIFHLYRWNSMNPKRDIKHLINEGNHITPKI